MAKPSKSVLTTLGDRVRRKRQAKGWSQEELADRAKLDRSYIGGIERGERNITILTLCQISQALGTDLAELGRGLPGQRR